jgi:methylthioribulose-1-phosphate dehydratase
VHTHSLASTVISLRYQSQKAVKLAGFELLKALEGINTHQTEILVPVFNNSQDMAALSAEIEGQSPASMHGFLLSGHGLYTWGNSIAAARRHTEALEFMFECLNMDRHQPVLNIKSVQSWQS